MKKEKTKPDACSAECGCEDPRKTGTAKKSKARRTAKNVTVGVTVALAVGAIAGLSVALAYSENMNALRAEYMRDMESVYTRNYYDLADSAEELDVNLGKLAAATTAAAQREILNDIRNAAGLAGVSLAAFRGGEEGVMQASKFMGQTGDYARYLAKRLQDGEPLTAEEREKLGKLREMSRVLRRALDDTHRGVAEGKPFLGDGGMLDAFTGAFEAFVDPEVEYPQMIYDGPFSDSLEHRECKALAGKSSITAEEGEKLVLEYIDGASSAEFYDRTEADIVTLNYTVETEQGKGFVQLTEKGGLLASYNMSPERAAVSDGLSEHCATAIAFARRAGYGDLAAVWCTAAHGTVYVNLAPMSDGAVLYPDLIKVKLDEGSGTVTGLDATHYVFNHTERSLPEPLLDVSEAAARVSLPRVGESRLALIPVDETREVLTYEFECESGGTYFVYIDAMTGEEANILYVVDDEDMGSMLM